MPNFPVEIPGASSKKPTQPKFSPGKGGSPASEFVITEKFQGGYRNREDITVLPPGVMIEGSQNVLTNTFERIGIRKGYTLDGQANTDIAPILAATDWDRHTGDTRHLRAGFNTTGSNGKHQFRYVAEASQSWSGNSFTAGQVFWIDLMTSLTSVEFNYSPFWNASDAQDELLFVNGSSNIYSWSGGVTTFASASNAAGSIASLALTTGAIASVNATPTVAGTGYTNGDTLTVTTGGGLGTVQVTSVGGGGEVLTIVLVSGGHNYTTGTGKAVTGGSGINCTIEITAIVTPGTGYALNDVLTITGGGGAGGTVKVTGQSGGVISAIQLITPGTGYSTGSLLATTGGTGTGALVDILTIATGYIEKQGTTTWAEEGFYISGTRSVTINGTVYTYTGGEGTLFLTGISPNPTTAGYTAGSVIFQTVRTTSNLAMTGIPATLENKLIAVLNNQTYVTGANNNSVYVSNVNDYTDYSFTSPVRVVGEGALLTLDAVPAALTPQENVMYISAGKDQWYQTIFTLSADLTAESLTINRLKTTTLQGAQSQAFCTKIKNNIAYLSFEPIINSLGLVQDILSFPQTTDLSFPIVNDMNTYNFTDGSCFYFKQFIYIAIPQENIVRIYNMTNPNNPYWEAPQILGLSRFSVIDGELYGHSYQVGETYKLFTGYNDNGGAIEAVAKFSFNGYGARFYSKSFNEFFVDGYIGTNTTLNLEMQYDLDGCATNTSIPIAGNDTRIVCSFSSSASLGKVSLGKNPLGGDLLVQEVPVPPYFHVIKTFPRIPFYFHSPSFRSIGIDQQWDIISFGGAATPTSEGNNAITE